MTFLKLPSWGDLGEYETSVALNLMAKMHGIYSKLVGGFNPSEKY